MYNSYKNVFSESYKCRICSAHFKNPEELRIHRMVSHKGHMLTIKR
jgi:stress-induced morphogen